MLQNSSDRIPLFVKIRTTLDLLIHRLKFSLNAEVPRQGYEHEVSQAPLSSKRKQLSALSACSTVGMQVIWREIQYNLPTIRPNFTFFSYGKYAWPSTVIPEATRW